MVFFERFGIWMSLPVISVRYMIRTRTYDQIVVPHVTRCSNQLAAIVPPKTRLLAQLLHNLVVTFELHGASLLGRYCSAITKFATNPLIVPFALRNSLLWGP